MIAVKALDLMKDLGEGFGEEEMSPEWPRCAESSQLDGYTLTKAHGQAVWAGARALEAVLGMHRGYPCYGEPGDPDCPHDSEYDGDRHFESADGWTLCEDTAGDDLHCSECSHADDDELTGWPCPTVSAVTAELGIEVSSPS